MFGFYSLSKAHLCHDRAGTDESAFPNHSVGVDDASGTDDHLVFDNDGASRQSILRAFPRDGVFTGDVAAEGDILADLHSGSDDDVARVFDGAVCADDGVVADVDVVAVVAGERVVDDDPRADAAWAGLRAVVIAVLVIWFASFGWVENAFEETSLLIMDGRARVVVSSVPVIDSGFASPAVFQQIFVDVGAVRFADEHFVFL